MFLILSSAALCCNCRDQYNRSMPEDGRIDSMLPSPGREREQTFPYCSYYHVAINLQLERGFQTFTSAPNVCNEEQHAVSLTVQSGASSQFVHLHVFTQS